jgi:hypothetical protein
MIKYLEILRLQAQNLSQRSIASSWSCSRSSVSEVLKRAMYFVFDILYSPKNAEIRCPLFCGFTVQTERENYENSPSITRLTMW